MCHNFMCTLSPVTCHLSPVTCHQHQHPQSQTLPLLTPPLEVGLQEKWNQKKILNQKIILTFPNKIGIVSFARRSLSIFMKVDLKKTSGLLTRGLRALH